MINFLFGVLCAAGAVFGALLTYTGIIDHSYEGVIAGGLFLFGSLLTIGIGQITRSMSIRQKRTGRVRHARRTEMAFRPETQTRPEPAIFPSAGPADPEEPVVPHPVLERVASRFARAGR